MFNIFIFQDRIAPPFPPAPRTPATTSEFQPPYFPPPFAPHGMLQAPTVQAEVFSSSMQPLNSADPYQVTSTLHQFQTQQVGGLDVLAFKEKSNDMCLFDFCRIKIHPKLSFYQLALQELLPLSACQA